MLFVLLLIAIPETYLLHFLGRVFVIYLLVIFLFFLRNFLTGLSTVYSEQERMKNKPLKGLLQTLQVIIFFVGGIVIIAILIGKEPWALLTGLGASAAILMLVFKDSIMGFVSGIMLTANNMLKVGDWISMP